ncbi:MAG TPA: hypothetical protein VK995_00325, partial [Oceanipulchritudo sp.]|nr:hypothetical protein [Oceanipulchritudo sp.]
MNSAQALTPSHQAFLEAQQRRVGSLREELDRLYPEPRTVVLEIGCGHGHYLTAYAQQHPDSICIG